MPFMLNIESLSIEELRVIVMEMQDKIMRDAIDREMEVIQIKALHAENEALRNVLTKRIVGLLVTPTLIEPDDEEEKEKKPGEDKSKIALLTADDAEKGKFQA